MGEARRKKIVQAETQIRFNMVMAFYAEHKRFPTSTEMTEIEAAVKYICTGNSAGLVKAAALVTG